MDSDIIEKDGNYSILHTLDENDFCLYCNNQLTEQNEAIFEIISDDYSDIKIYCKPCAAIFLRDMNLRVAEENGLKGICFTCGTPNKECKCNAKTIDYKLRKKLK
jgi:hypothetical protein